MKKDKEEHEAAILFYAKEKDLEIAAAQQKHDEELSQYKKQIEENDAKLKFHE